MNYLKTLRLVISVVAALMLLSASASATTLEKSGSAINASITIEATLKSGTSAILKDKNGTTNDTCTGSEVKGSTERDEGGKGDYTGTIVSGKVSSLTFTGCSHTTDVVKDANGVPMNGRLGVSWSTGTNGTVSSSEAEITVKSTVFGVSAICKTGAGTVVGTLTGVSSGFATMDINATTLDCGALGTSTWTGTYIVTNPEGLGVTS